MAENLEALIKAARGRVFITTFASQTHRVQNIIKSCEKLGRRVIMEGP